MMKVLILVVSADFPPFDELTKAIKETWASSELPDVQIYFYYGKNGRNGKKNTRQDIYFNIKEGYYSLGYKTLKMFRYIKNLNYDYIFRTNSSSYINQSQLLEFLLDKPRAKFYCGIIPFLSPKFASGCGYFLSRDLVNLVLKNKRLWNHKLLDDVALGELLSLLDIPIDNRAKRVDMFGDDGKMLDIENINVNEHYHFRCKYPQEKPFVTNNDRSNDINAIKLLNEYFNKVC